MSRISRQLPEAYDKKLYKLLFYLFLFVKDPWHFKLQSLLEEQIVMSVLFTTQTRALFLYFIYTIKYIDFSND